MVLVTGLARTVFTKGFSRNLTISNVTAVAGFHKRLLAIVNTGVMTAAEAAHIQAEPALPTTSPKAGGGMKKNIPVAIPHIPVASQAKTSRVPAIDVPPNSSHERTTNAP